MLELLASILVILFFLFLGFYALIFILGAGKAFLEIVKAIRDKPAWMRQRPNP